MLTPTLITDRTTWNDHLPVLEQNYQILNYDLYGHGESAPPPETPSRTRPARICLSGTLFHQFLRFRPALMR